MLRAVNWLRGCIMRLPGRVRPKRVVFESFGGRGYSSSSRAVSEALHALRPDAEIVWLFTDPESKKQVVPPYVECVRIHSVRGIRMLRTAGTWVMGTMVPKYFSKHPGQMYIQVWHGLCGFKLVLEQSWKAGMIDPEIMDLGTTGSKTGEYIYRDRMHYSGELLMAGEPKYQPMLRADAQARARLRASLGIAENERVLLFAPTMREGAKTGTQNVSALRLDHALDVLTEADGRPWRAFTRAHHVVKGLSGIAADPRIEDHTADEDINDLLIACDALITDYSSCACDFSLLEKPVILYIPDYEDYVSHERGLYVDIDKSPYVTAKSEAELDDVLRRLNGIDWHEKRLGVEALYGMYETGGGADAAAERISAHMDGRDR
ncbi:MAG: CDP-glycerol glycerophosphotransferase family protein [Clostridia bacterium]|nr:CDP-glycerol glycerophosphotransferase family protein [Clostridia bacterium]